MVNNYDFRRFAGAQGGSGLLGGLITGLGARGSAQLRQDELQRQQQQDVLGALRYGVNPTKLQDPAYLEQISEERRSIAMAPSGSSEGERLLNMLQQGNLTPEQEKFAKARLDVISKDPTALYQQAYQGSLGKGQAELGYKPELASQEELAKQRAKNIAASEESLASQESKLPELQNTIEKLRGLSDVATYTYGGQARDFLARQLGATTEGAQARTEYEAIVNNQILPLLRDTFGAAFTVKEGESLRATLGDPNKSPSEKQAVLDSFINQKIANVSSERRKLGVEQQPQIQESQNMLNNNDPLGLR